MFYEETVVVEKVKRPETELQQFFSFCYKRRKLFYSIFLVLISSLIYLYLRFSWYESSLQMTFNPVQHQPEEMSDNEIVAGIKQSASFKRVFQIVNSREMMDYLASKYNLYSHYKIADDEFRLANFNQQYKKYFNVRATPNDLIIVTVADRYSRTLPAEMANDIGVKIEEINRKWFLNQIRQKVEINDSIRVEAMRKFQLNNSEISSYLEKLEGIQKENLRDEKVNMITDRLLSATNSLLTGMDEITRAFSNYKWLEITTREDNFNQIIITSPAYPEFRHYKIHPFIFYPLSVIGTFALTIFVMYAWLNFLILKKDLGIN